MQNTYIGLVLPGIGSGLAIFLLRQFFMKIPPSLAEAARIDGLSWWGVFAVPGLLQELNFGYDPEAAHAVLTSGAPITLVPYDVTRLTSLTLADLDRLAGHVPLADYLAETTRPWVRWVAEARRLPGCHLHDPLAVAVLLEPGLATRHHARVDVELRGTLTRARPIAWDATGQVMRATGLRLPGIEPIEVLDGVDNDRLVAYLIDTIVRAGR